MGGTSARDPLKAGHKCAVFATSATTREASAQGGDSTHRSNRP